MGQRNSTPLLFGSFKVTGAELYAEKVVIPEPGQVEIGKSADLVFRISSYERGVFHMRAKYLGGEIRELGFQQRFLIELLHGSEASETYQRLARIYDYRREGTRIGFSKTFSLDATRLLPYLYEKFGKQNLIDEGEELIQKAQFRRMSMLAPAGQGKGKGASAKTPAAESANSGDAKSKSKGKGKGKSKAASGPPAASSTEELDRSIRELEELELGLSSALNS